MGKFLLCLSLALTILASATVQAETKMKSAEATASTSTVATVTEAPIVEQSTESPIADMALIDGITPTEKTPVVVSGEELVKQLTTEEKSDPQPHTVADFIIHPLIAFKPRQSGPIEEGKQASSATPAPATTWLFGMNPAQGLGSSFSTLAGSVSGWFNDRLAAAGQQLPGLVDTPVRESTTTSSTTTTTQRPDIVVRLQQRPNRRQPVNANGNANGNFNGNNGNFNGNNGNRRRQQQRPNRFNNRPNRLDSLEDDDEYYDDDDDEFYPNQHFDDDDEDDVDVIGHNDDDNNDDDEAAAAVGAAANSDDEDQDDQEASVEEKPVKKQRKQPLNQRRKFSSPQASTNNKRRNQQQKPQNFALLEEDDENDDLDDAEDDDEDGDGDGDVDVDSVEETNQAPNFFYGQSTRRSQNQPNFIQRGQQSIISQIRQFTRGQTPAELGATLRRTYPSQGGSSAGAHSKASRRPQQTTFLLNRNGQTVYVAPELLNYPYAYAAGPAAQAVPVKRQRPNIQSSFPQPPLTVPVRRGPGRPTQYITIPWSQLGLSPPDQQSIVSLAEGLQAQPLILNIPQSAIQPTNQKSQKKKQRPQLTAAAVPLLADASLMDIFQPPQIPPSRTGTNTNKKPVLIAAKPVKANGGAATAAATSAGLLPTRIRPGTIVEKAPSVAEAVPEKQPSPSPSEQQQQQPALAAAASETTSSSSASSASTEVPPAAAEEPQEQYIIVGNDEEPGLSRQAAVQPAFGDARYVSYGNFHPYFDYRHQTRRFALRKTGRQLNQDDDQQEDLE